MSPVTPGGGSVVGWAGRGVYEDRRDQTAEIDRLAWEIEQRAAQAESQRQRIVALHAQMLEIAQRRKQIQTRLNRTTARLNHALEANECAAAPVPDAVAAELWPSLD